MNIFITICFLNFSIALGHGIVSPILPLYARSFGVSTTEVGLLMSAYALARLITDLPAGYFNQRYGVSRTILAALLLTVLSATMLGMARSFWALVFWRFWQGAGSALFVITAMSVVADLSPEDRLTRNIALYQGSHHVGSSFGPSLGGVAAQYGGYRLPFFIYASLMTLAGSLLGRHLLRGFRLKSGSETTAGGSKGSDRAKRGHGEGLDTWGMIKQVVTNRSFLLIALVEFMIFFARSGPRQTIVPLLGATDLGLKVSQIGYAFTLAAFSQLCPFYLAGWLGDRFGVKRVLIPSMLLASFGFQLFAMSEAYLSYLVAAVVIGLGAGLGNPLPPAYAVQVRGDVGHGLIVGAIRFFGDVGLMCGPVVMGMLSDAGGYSFALTVNASLMAGIVVLFWLAATIPDRPKIS